MYFKYLRMKEQFKLSYRKWKVYGVFRMKCSWVRLECKVYCWDEELGERLVDIVWEFCKELVFYCVCNGE